MNKLCHTVTNEGYQLGYIFPENPIKTELGKIGAVVLSYSTNFCPVEIRLLFHRNGVERFIFGEEWEVRYLFSQGGFKTRIEIDPTISPRNVFDKEPMPKT